MLLFKFYRQYISQESAICNKKARQLRETASLNLLIYAWRSASGGLTTSQQQSTKTKQSYGNRLRDGDTFSVKHCLKIIGHET